MLPNGGTPTDEAVKENVCANCALYLVQSLCGAIANPRFMTPRLAHETCEDFVSEPTPKPRRRITR